MTRGVHDASIVQSLQIDSSSAIQGAGTVLVRVVLADHHRQALRALRILLQEEPDLELVGEAADAQGLLTIAEQATADLIMVDRKLPGGHTKDLISRLHALKPRPIVIVMSSDFEDSRMMLQAGADAFVSKAEQPEWLLESLRHYTGHIGNSSGSEGQSNGDRI